MAGWMRVALLAALVVGALGERDWTYNCDDVGLLCPVDWKQAYARCEQTSSNLQSPVDILEEDLRIGKDMEFLLETDEKVVDMVLAFDGVDVRMDFRNRPPKWFAPRMTVYVSEGEGEDAEEKPVRYVCQELLFRAPSEHLFSGHRRELEAQLMCENEEDATDLTNVALFFKGIDGNKNTNLWLESVVDGIADNGGNATEWTAHVKMDTIDMILPDSLDHFEYMGSLTTPPCKENDRDVRWRVMKEMVEVDESHIEQLTRLFTNYNSNGGLQKGNTRPEQALEGRVVTRINTHGREKDTRLELPAVMGTLASIVILITVGGLIRERTNRRLEHQRRATLLE